MTPAENLQSLMIQNDRLAGGRAEYMEHLRRLVLALVQTHGQMTVRALHERANQAIMDFGIRDAADRVRRVHG